MKLQHRILLSLLALFVLGDIAQVASKFTDRTKLRSNDLKRAAENDILDKRAVSLAPIISKYKNIYHNAITPSRVWGKVHQAVVLRSAICLVEPLDRQNV